MLVHEDKIGYFLNSLEILAEYAVFLMPISGMEKLHPKQI